MMCNIHCSYVVDGHHVIEFMNTLIRVSNFISFFLNQINLRKKQTYIHLILGTPYQDTDQV
jgi:hypothetical protein